MNYDENLAFVLAETDAPVNAKLADMIANPNNPFAVLTKMENKFPVRLLREDMGAIMHDIRQVCSPPRGGERLPECNRDQLAPL